MRSDVRRLPALDVKRRGRDPIARRPVEVEPMTHSTRRSVLLFALWLTATAEACSASARRPTERPVATAPARDTAPSRSNDPVVDANLDALVSRGTSLADHVGPDAARAIFDDLYRRPDAYLDRLEARYVAPPPASGYDSLLLAVPLWRLRRHDDARVRHIAARLADRDRALAQLPATADDPYRPQRLSERAATMELLRGGVDVVAGPRWTIVPASALHVTVASAPDGTDLLRVTRGCACGEPLACRAAVVDGVLRVEVRVDPDTAGVCTECYAVSTACTLPARAPAAMVVNGVAQTLARGDG